MMAEELQAAPDAEVRPAEMFNNFVQIGIVVRDLDRTVKALNEVFGIGPWRFITYPPPERGAAGLEYRGEPGHFAHRIAFASLGPIEMEICEPVAGAGPSSLTEYLDEHGEGIQHIRFNVPELQPVLDYLTGRGIGCVMSGPGIRPGTRWYHMDTSAQVGFVLELMNVLPGTDGRTPEIIDGKPVVDGKVIA